MTDIPVQTAEDLALSWRRRALALGLSHREVDFRASLPDGYFSKLVAGMKAPTIETAVRVCAALKMRMFVDNEIAALKCGDVCAEHCNSPKNARDYHERFEQAADQFSPDA